MADDVRPTKALSLTQPWATLIALKAKRVETRSWSTHFRGPVAIHAAKGFPASARDLCWTLPFGDALGDLTPSKLPVGAIVATAYIDGCRFTEDVARQLDEPELSFGDYSPGRFAWFLSSIIALDKPIPCKGALGLWTIPPDIRAQLPVATGRATDG